jgi:hypothetical protein
MYACRVMGVPSVPTGYSHRPSFSPPERVDAIHIDGMHREENVYADLVRAYSLKPKVILGHDVLHPPGEWFGVKKALDRFCSERGLAYLIVPLTGGLFVLPLPENGGMTLGACKVALIEEGIHLHDTKQSWIHVDRVVPIPLPKGGVMSTRCIAVLSDGPGGEAMSELSLPSVRKYAEKVGADLTVFGDGGYPEFILANKFRVATLLDHYERVLYLDADVIVNPAAGDVFEAVPSTHMAMKSDYGPLHARGRLVDWFARDVTASKRSQGMPVDPRRPCDSYYNTGFMLFSREHRGAFDPPKKPVPNTWCQEQNWISLNVTEKYKYPVVSLGGDIVWDWWSSNESPHRDGKPRPMDEQEREMGMAWFLHFCGMGHTPGNAMDRLYLMSKWGGER